MGLLFGGEQGRPAASNFATPAPPGTALALRTRASVRRTAHRPGVLPGGAVQASIPAGQPRSAPVRSRIPRVLCGKLPAAQATFDPFSRIPAGGAPCAFRTPAGSAEGPVPPGTARHTVPVSCREGRCAVCLHCAAHRPGVLPGGTRGQVSWRLSRAAASCWAAEEGFPPSGLPGKRWPRCSLLEDRHGRLAPMFEAAR